MDGARGRRWSSADTPLATGPLGQKIRTSAFFVRDGNHRVSVMRELGAEYIQAYVTSVVTKVPLSPTDDPTAIILKAEYAKFLQDTELDELRPEASLEVTAPGRYEDLREHIRVHRYFMGLEEDRDVPYEEAVAHWYDHVYLPVVRAIRASRLLDGFAGRTETDLYLWLGEHRARLQEELGWTFSTETIAENVRRGSRFSSEQRDEMLRDLIQNPKASDGIRLADDVLVGLGRGDEALEQALMFARRERATLFGLQVFATKAEAESDEALQTRERFEWRCAEVGVEGQYAEAVGVFEDVLLERAPWVDMVVVAPEAPVEPGLVLASAFRTLLRNCPRPLLVVPEHPRPLRRALLAYDGSPRAEEALFASAYAIAKWHVDLSVISVAEDDETLTSALGRARGYLDRFRLDATYLEASAPVATAILDAAETHRSDVILMGSYSYSRWLESMLGGVLDEVLSRSDVPVLVT